MRQRRRSTWPCCSAGGSRPTCLRSRARFRLRATKPRTVRRASRTSSRPSSRIPRRPSTSSRSVLPRRAPSSTRPNVKDTEPALHQHKERIAKTIAFLKTLDKAAIDASSEREITFPLGPNKGQMKGADYLNHFVLPNFYFHLSAAYGIVRNCGVDIGKRDFLGAIPLKTI